MSRKEADAALIVASDPVGNSPRVVMEHFAQIPTIVLDPYETPTTRIAEVVFPVTISGVESEGTAYRMDSVPLRLRKIKSAPKGILTDYEVLNGIIMKYKQLAKKIKKNEE
jgi:formylmethanofuran dehydrogenase subunit B